MPVPVKVHIPYARGIVARMGRSLSQMERKVEASESHSPIPFFVHYKQPSDLNRSKERTRASLKAPNALLMCF